MSLEHVRQYCISQSIRWEEDYPMSHFTSFKVGGPAQLFAQPADVDQIAGLLSCAQSHDVPVTIVGRGSNLLVSDEGIGGLTISVGDEMAGIELRDGHQIYCQAGASLSKLCRFAMKNGLSGLEFAYGIPGNLGGAVIMNAGAYGGEIGDVVLRVDHLDEKAVAGSFSREQAGFTYRGSTYSQGHYCVTGALLQLRPGDPDAILSVMNEIIEKRKAKQPLDYPSAGSTFKRPEGNFASTLIDQCGLKGRKVGGAMVSPKHAGFIINHQNATCADIKNLIETVQKEVFRQTGYRLECEVKMIERSEKQWNY